MEYGAVLDVLRELEDGGSTVTYIPVNQYGVLKYDLLEQAVRDDTAAIVCSHGSNVTGNITDMEKIGAVARKNHLKLIVDGCSDSWSYSHKSGGHADRRLLLYRP